MSPWRPAAPRSPRTTPARSPARAGRGRAPPRRPWRASARPPPPRPSRTTARPSPSAVEQREQAAGALGHLARVREPARVPLRHLAQHHGAGARPGGPCRRRRRCRPARGARGRRRAPPRAPARRPTRRGRARSRSRTRRAAPPVSSSTSATSKRTFSRPAASTSSCAVLIALAVRSTPTALHPGMGRRDADQVRAGVAAELEHARRARVGRREPVQRGDGRVAARQGLRERHVLVGHFVVGRVAFSNLFPRALATCLGWPLQMPAVVDVPLNTCLADLDEALRTLLKRELERHGFEGVEIAFDAPATDWSAKLTNPTVNLFLYDLRENVAASRGDHARRARQRRDDVRAAADAPRGHLLGDRVDEGGPGRAPAALAGARDPLLARLAARATCSKAASRARACSARSRPRSAGRRRRRPTSGPRSAAATRRRSTTR